MAFLADWVARLDDWVDLTSWTSSQATGITNKSFLGHYSSQPWSNMASWVSIVLMKFPCLWKRIQLQPFVFICVWELNEIISTISCDKTCRHDMQLFFLYFRYRFLFFWKSTFPGLHSSQTTCTPTLLMVFRIQTLFRAEILPTIPFPSTAPKINKDLIFKTWEITEIIISRVIYYWLTLLLVTVFFVLLLYLEIFCNELNN